jgi:hypothetical protein
MVFMPFMPFFTVVLVLYLILVSMAFMAFMAFNPYTYPMLECKDKIPEALPARTAISGAQPRQLCVSRY